MTGNNTVCCTNKKTKKNDIRICQNIDRELRLNLENKSTVYIPPKSKALVTERYLVTSTSVLAHYKRR